MASASIALVGAQAPRLRRQRQVARRGQDLGITHGEAPDPMLAFKANEQRPACERAFDQNQRFGILLALGAQGLAA